jgi:hypothetical protein
MELRGTLRASTCCGAMGSIGPARGRESVFALLRDHHRPAGNREACVSEVVPSLSYGGLRRAASDRDYLNDVIAFVVEGFVDRLQSIRIVDVVDGALRELPALVIGLELRIEPRGPEFP